ncbi:putative glycerol dehydrogenase Gcy1 [Aspergillus ibericus CBS 121593]|uniref:D-xylose reductase [NAD(P)H] n=1 Tax=Aspergillus ibericus CBS 121593 TaxID=1448316 RepID=A0A395HAD6_9EURO|nr:putative glycerol dehydrogenase Gcy1 [Aspergillus ibericus CBS 121593]RAL03868.1 putative glycerol dehydrogenase Gcy1 [Aspergillus ibericus CBS 121593]
MATLNFTQKKGILNTGAEIPLIGLGTWQCKSRDAVVSALLAGYRHIDTAAVYGNEAEVGQAIKDSGVPRQEIFLTTKLGNQWHTRVPEGLAASLQALQTDYVDLYLMHWPCAVDPDDRDKVVPNWDYVNTWIEMQKLPATGKVKAIGVSNFGITHLERLLADAAVKIVPAVNQIELHPCHPSPKLVAYNTAKGIHTTGYSCLGSIDSLLYKNPTIIELAQQKGRSIQQVLLKWGLQKGWSVIPKSANPERIQANFDLDGWELSPEEMKAIDGIPTRFKIFQGGLLPPAMDGKVFLGDDE